MFWLGVALCKDASEGPHVDSSIIPQAAGSLQKQGLCAASPWVKIIQLANGYHKTMRMYVCNVMKLCMCIYIYVYTYTCIIYIFMYKIVILYIYIYIL